MARKKKKNSKSLRIGALSIPKPMLAAAMAALQSPIGKIILAEALIQGAAMLTTRHPTAAAAAAGAGAATAAKDAAGGAGDAVAKFMHSAADLLKGDTNGKHRGKKKHRKAREDFNMEPDGHETGSSTGRGDEVLNREAIREILVGELSRHRARKKAKHAARH